MRYSKSAVLLCGVFLLAIVNILPNTAYKGATHPVEGNAIQVYAADPGLDEPTVPILNSPNSILSTNKERRVTVYLSSDYRGQELWDKPGSTLKILVVFVGLYCLAGILARRASNQK